MKRNRYGVGSLVCAAALSVWMTGCAADFNSVPASTGATGLGQMQGSVHGGQQPIVGASVALYAASTQGYGAASTLLTPVPAITDVNGSFLLTGTYTCTPGQQVYLLATGGNPGVTGSVTNPLPTNPASALMGVLGTCPAAGTFATQLPFLQISEISTIAAAYAMAPFAVDAKHVGSTNTTQALNGIQNAFVNAGKIYDVSGAHGLSATKATPVGAGILPQALVNTLADILGACVNTVQTVGLTGNSPSAVCQTLLSTATSDGTANGTAPTETATAAINMAHHPGLNATTLTALVTSTAAFQPTQGGLTDLSLYVIYSGPSVITPKQIGIDSQGSVWFNNFCTETGSSVTKFSNAGVLISPSAGYTAGTAEQCGYGITVDQSDNVWTDSRPAITDPNLALAFKFSSAGSLLSPAAGFATGLIDNDDLTTDPSGNVWMTDFYGNTIVKLSPSGTILSPTVTSPPLNLPGYTAGGLNASLHLASDAGGNIWIPSSGALVEVDNNGNALTGAAGITGGGLSGNTAGGVAIDHAGNAWVTGPTTSTLIKVNSSRGVLSPGVGYTAPSLATPSQVAVDGDGNVFVSNYGPGGLTEFSNNGTLLSGPYGYTGGGILYNNTISYGMSYGFGMQVDSSGDLWTVEISGQINGFLFSDNSVYEFIGIAAPAVTPLSVALKNNTLGTRP